MLTILFDGIAYGMLLFVLACGLAVTLGLMNFVNLAHGTFAMAGGYCAVIVVNNWGVPFLLALPIAFLSLVPSGSVSPGLFDVIKVVGSSEEAVPIIRESYERWLEQEERIHGHPGAGS